MDATRFDRWTRSLTSTSSRRTVLRLASAALGLAAARLPGSADAKKKRKHKKLELNAFGCLDVGLNCAGNDGLCCSGVCQGKRPKKGEKDKSRCIAHNVGSCTAEQNLCIDVGSSSCGVGAQCRRTTGKAGFCAGSPTYCEVCKKDTDCDVQLYGPGAACTVCPADCAATGNTACATAA